MKLRIENITALLPAADGTLQARACDVCVEGDSILSVGPTPANFQPDRTLSGRGKLLLPGLINCHTHAYMTIFRNYADDLAFQDWLFGRILPKEDELSPKDAYWGTMLACSEMLKTGTTCFLDMHLFPGAVDDAALDCGIRAVLSRGLVGGDDETGHTRLDAALEEAAAYGGEPLLTHMLAPHAIYSCEEALWRIVRDEAEKRGMRIHTHLSESRKEVADCFAAHGCSPVAWLEKLGVFDVPTVAAHCVHLSDDDIAILAAHGVSVATNPISNLKLANGVAPVPKLLDAGVNVCLGTDGCGSNNALNMFREMGVCALIHKGIGEDPTAVTAQQTLQFATSAAARALGFGNSLGVIAPGAKADLVLLDIERPEFYPRNSLVSSLCYSANGGGVDTVLVNGELVLENGRLTRFDEERIRFEAQHVADRLGMRVDS